MISPNGIRAVLFDLDGTLRHNRPSANRTFFEFAAQCGLPDGRERRRRALRWAHYYWANSAEMRADLDSFDGDEQGFWGRYAFKQLLASGCPADLADACAPEVHRKMADEYQPEDWIPEEVPRTISHLKATGFTIGVVSNRDDPLEHYLDEIELQPFLDFSLAAGQINSYKPDPAIFQHALRQAGTRPDQTLYVGDNYYADIIGADRVGIRPVLLDPERIFPEATCPVIQSIEEVLGMLT